MNADQLKGKWTQFKGELGGDYEKFIGKVQERYGDKKTELMKWADTCIRSRQRKPRKRNSPTECAKPLRS